MKQNLIIAIMMIFLVSCGGGDTGTSGGGKNVNQGSNNNTNTSTSSDGKKPCVKTNVDTPPQLPVC